MDLSQHSTDNVVKILDLTGTDLMYQCPYLMHMEDGIPVDYQISFENVETGYLENLGIQQYILEPNPMFYLAPISSEDVTNIIQGQNESSRYLFAHQEEKNPQNTPKKNSPLKIDFKKVTEKTTNSGQNCEGGNDDDVIFVREYKAEEQNNKSWKTVASSISKFKPLFVSDIITRGSCSSKQDLSVRRNPSRQARNLKSRQKFSGEHLLEEDFAFLDESDDEDLVPLRKDPVPSTSSKLGSAITSFKENSSPNENFKIWPINVYERPEYNPKTKQTEPFDYTIREIGKCFEKRKPQLEATFKSKPKKRYFVRKRKPKDSKPVEKVSINEIGDKVRETYNMVKKFYEDQGEKNAAKFEFLLKNESVLVSIIEDFK